MRNNAEKLKIKIVLAAVLVVVILSSLTFFFVRDVKTILWEQSILTILESTQQGCNTLRVQLQDGYDSIDRVAEYLAPYSMEQKNELKNILNNNEQITHNISLYLADGTYLSADAEKDEKAIELLLENEEKVGILDPHISSVTGVTVFNLYTKISLQDGTEAYLLKEYAVDEIVDSFSLSFYNGAGFSYVVDTTGNVLIRSPHPNSNKTIKNLFDMLPVTKNTVDDLQIFSQSLQDLHTGWAVFEYQGEQTVFGYTPLKLQSDWYLISIIPKKVVDAQTYQILLHALFLIGCIILGISLLVSFYFRYAQQTNRKLRNQASYIAHLYNAVPEGIALITVESPYRLIQVNQEGLRLLGYSQEATNDAPQGRLLQEIIFPEDYENVIKHFQDVEKQNQKRAFEHRFLTADGNCYWVSGIVEKILDENGNPIFIATFHDITSEKMEAERREREKLVERITLVGALSNAYPVIVSLNLSKNTLNYIYVAPELKVGVGVQRTYSELFDDITQIVHPDQLTEFQQRFALKTLQRSLGIEKKEVFMDIKMRLKDGTYHWTSTQIIYVDNPYAEDKLAILISRRIDEQRHEEEQQRQALQSALDSAMVASKAKSEFLSNMSHDIRTPINAIVGMTAIATTHLHDAGRVMECLQKINLSSKHLLSLINDILDMSKIESGKLSLREEPFNFAELVSEVVELVRAQAKEKQLTIDIRLAMLENENVIGDPLRVQQICINILSNAVKYTLVGGSISVEVKQEGCMRKGYQNYIFRCADTGIGMPAEFLKKLFQPFERAQDSTTNKVTGTGLGMAITKNVIDLMNGDIAVESKPGEGSVFTVTIPLQVQDAPQEVLVQDCLGMHTLIVDDDQQTCENVMEILDSLGLRPQFVLDGRTAVTTVIQAQHTPDPFQLVIIDWKMPDMDGVEVVKQIRKKIGPEIPVIVFTAYDWADIEYEAKTVGVTAFLSKPFYRSKVCYLLNELVEEKTPQDNLLYQQRYLFTGKRILLAEDNEINREIARTLLEEMGILIEEAHDGEEAVKKVTASQEGYYDLILMDIQMPTMDGYEATTAIRALNRQDSRTMPIIAMTANAFDDDVRAALRAGMNAHFAKPIDLKKLEQLLYHYLVAESEK